MIGIDLKQTLKGIVTELLSEGWIHVPNRREQIASGILSALVTKNPSESTMRVTVRTALQWTDELIKQIEESNRR